jgi:MoaA/NifB/PqqE/SkfB family radical SAM enzyme
MLTEEMHAASVLDARAADPKVAQHEDAAHEKRNWVRLTYECNNRCIFCLDSDTHDGEMRDAEDVKKQILEGRRRGATRLILSGGEPTIHPRYLDFVKLGRLAGYRRVQTVTNGRLFAYGDFLGKCLEAGLQEITFSLHGPNARIHDALVGVKGAFEQEMGGLRAALRDGRPIVNVDVVINKGNVKVLPEMLELFYAEGVRELDLLQVVPFGRAFTEGRDTLFYDLEEAAPQIRAALEFSERPDVHVWFNRFPPPFLEGYEHLIQDPYKLNDEVRGRKEEFARQLDEGEKLDCRDPGRCRYCYLERLCDTLEHVQRTHAERSFERLRVDTTWEAAQPPAFGGDPASARRARADGRVGLPVIAGAAAQGAAAPPERLAADASARVLSVRAPDLASARAEIARFASIASIASIELDLDRWEELGEALAADGTLDGRALSRATAHDVVSAEALLALPHAFEVEVLLTRETAPFLLALASPPARLALRQPTHERLTEAASTDVDLPAFFSQLGEAWAAVPVEGVPACILGRAPRVAPPTFDATMADAEGRLEIFRYTRRYILEHYLTKSRRCRDCAHDTTCEGMHINQVRAHGYAWMQPVVAAAE